MLHFPLGWSPLSFGAPFGIYGVHHRKRVVVMMMRKMVVVMVAVPLANYLIPSSVQNSLNFVLLLICGTLPIILSCNHHIWEGALPSSSRLVFTCYYAYPHWCCFGVIVWHAKSDYKKCLANPKFVCFLLGDSIRSYAPFVGVFIVVVSLYN
jgi:hypothetical protein